MNKRTIGCAIVAALLGGGLVWAADHRTAEGIDGWGTLNAGMAQALGVEEGADAASAGKTEGNADPAGAGGNEGAAAAVVSSGAVNSGTAEAAGSSETVNGSDSPGAEPNGEAVKDSDAAGTGAQGTAGGGGTDAAGIAGAAGSTAAAADGRVNVNTADAAALMNLPGIGEKKAQAIIDYRSSKGAFRSLADLGKVKGIGPKMLEKLEGLVTF
ncbi:MULTISPECIES: helix-hairpin-helix domain-containing protein [unclassified Paenibacillus]|uniref:ComEA family DNA-binding protein n=1 Tax=unclassified Paenibacillus TaxID=185978 RepID=UPI00240770A2|nr:MULTISPECIES: helix-hairpin-helix domain-containing protein [unclassified Paenibacillus]MDF9843974.1 competence protein ComEA [Paenibacillus sp. PastF-2]MDF9850579.1 competence protein ComEA [Paenibacillus sp. PastM-2]MDF9856305.1 competence protein ComEA [Paenibacillus sp. PastF-1]MDH6481466.1 competence protein ComEA [Paenibacillus sp. PastH-2]MDH6509780.1 competence protein ComEA [Paenibacillus sp. PastM-3]